MGYYLVHHGILGQKWGVRRYQNPDGTLTPAGRRHLERQDVKWVRKNEKKINKIVGKAVESQIRQYDRNELRPKYRQLRTNGKANKNYINAYNKKLASLMDQAIGDFEVPSGRVIRFVAKRGTMGTYIALADKYYDMNQLRNGVYSSGKVAYKKKSVSMTNG